MQCEEGEVPTTTTAVLLLLSSSPTYLLTTELFLQMLPRPEWLSGFGLFYLKLFHSTTSSPSLFDPPTDPIPRRIQYYFRESAQEIGVHYGKEKHIEFKEPNHSYLFHFDPLFIRVVVLLTAATTRTRPSVSAGK
ncbi:hypothetical protein Fcan01_24632 [Folsomia candida]|uniref:Uncharacterized protein n=1 Tax=Folsomia candida TaxID=158441 RepID=A0A226D843_FOLCA|nr:hypothetical protein Fcan01_24632 [Folsomia candida]